MVYPYEKWRRTVMELIQTEYKKSKVVGSTILGSITYNFASLKALHNNTVQERRKIGDKGASLEYRIALSGVSASLSGKSNTSNPTKNVGK